MNHSFKQRLKNLKISDLVAFFPFVAAFLISIITRFLLKDTYVIAEDENEARDNGFVLFQYMRKNHKDKKVIYVINKKSSDYEKVKNLGSVIQYGGLRHWMYYLSSQKYVTTQKGGKPNAAICYVLEVYGLIKPRTIFIQHGVIINDLHWLYYKNTKMKLFICGALPEYEYVSQRFGYPQGSVKYLGLCRFDNYFDLQVNKKKVLIMPTWREWLVSQTEARDKFNYDGVFTNTEYYKKWSELLNAQRFNDLIKENDLEVYFYPHRNMQKYINDFVVNKELITIADWKEHDIQDLLKSSAVLVTDYSSVMMDFGYMKKPVMLYQFDYKQFREGQYAEGYFNYATDNFGPVDYNLESFIDSFEKLIQDDFNLSVAYQERVDRFYPLRDNQNCERTIQAIEKVR